MTTTKNAASSSPSTPTVHIAPPQYPTMEMENNNSNTNEHQTNTNPELNIQDTWPYKNGQMPMQDNLCEEY
uniref:Uncharacterized protein n=1 Tax=Panagrolaimus sp. ES5 TaxID=591445 RepID=A0AC34FK28_9BILA